ncbi:hypothetical protein CCP3SC1AL1_1530002 [Gammaproteobacteria bacterium]
MILYHIYLNSPTCLARPEEQDFLRILIVGTRQGSQVTPQAMAERVTGLISHRRIKSKRSTDSDSEVGRSAADFRVVRSEKVACNSQGACHDNIRFLMYLEHQLWAVGLKVMRVEGDNHQTLAVKAPLEYGVLRTANRVYVRRESIMDDDRLRTRIGLQL